MNNTIQSLPAGTTVSVQKTSANGASTYEVVGVVPATEVTHNIRDHADFEWRNRKSLMIPIGTMQTSYLFSIVKMIWNNVVPHGYTFGTVKRYHFPRFYTPEYLRQAIISMVAILVTREDLSEHQKQVLQNMTDILTEFQKKLDTKV